jgi:hypothetical protein
MPATSRRPSRIRPAALAVVAVIAVAGVATRFPMGATAAGRSAHPGPILALHAGQSSNWFGYNQGILEKAAPFNQVAADWNVPSASLRNGGQNEYSATWVGIGGGCLDTACTVTDASLIQAGTSQDVSSSGAVSYSAWWEVIPAPSLSITTMTVGAGDHMHVDIRQLAPEVWTITVQDVSRGETFTQTVPYASTFATAEWIEEAPTVIDTSGSGLATLPNLSTSTFDLAQVNNAPAGLNAAEQISLIDSAGHVIGTPSAPDSDTDGFNACAYATSCAGPGGS